LLTIERRLCDADWPRRADADGVRIARLKVAFSPQ